MDPDMLIVTHHLLTERRDKLHARIMTMGQRLMTLEDGPERQYMMSQWEKATAALDRADECLLELAERIKNGTY